MVIPHPSMSAMHFELKIRGEQVELRDLDSTNGLHLGSRRVYHVELKVGDIFTAGDAKFELLDAGEVEIPISSDDRFEQMWGDSPVIREVFAQLEGLATSMMDVLLVGETGTGKEIAARSIHLRSGREGPFIVLDCAGISAQSIDSAFEDAEGGTLLLDEIGELSLSLQPRLLRVLNRRQIPGERGPKAVDVRVVAATHADLPKLVANDRFREDLYFRVAQAVVDLPPLRERGDDVELLAAYFLVEQVSQMGGRVFELSDDARSALRDHRWSGNVRELRNVIQRATHLARSSLIHATDLALRDHRDMMGLEELLTLPYREAHNQLDRYYLRRIMAETRGNITHAARRLKTSRRSLRVRLKRLNLYSG